MLGFLDELLLEPGAFYVMDRGYVNFERSYGFAFGFGLLCHSLKRGMQYRRLDTRAVHYATGVRYGQLVLLKQPGRRKHYPDKLRPTRYLDEESGMDLVLQVPLANELFFKWIKQNQRIKHFMEPPITR